MAIHCQYNTRMRIHTVVVAKGAMMPVLSTPDAAGCPPIAPMCCSTVMDSYVNGRVLGLEMDSAA